jgi:hypothetical protein
MDSKTMRSMFHVHSLMIVNSVVGFPLLRRLKGYKGRRDPRRAVHRFLVGLVAVLGILWFSPQSALAESGTKFLQGDTACFSELEQSGGRLVYYGYGYAGVTTRRATLGPAIATVDAYRCNGPKEDIPLVVSHLTVQLIYTIPVIGVSQCQAGLPKDVSCTFTGNTMMIKATHTCSNASSCTVETGPYNVYPGLTAFFAGAGLQIQVSGQQRGEPSRGGSSSRVVWHPFQSPW